MPYWRLQRPRYNGYQHSYVNGGGRHPYGFPGVRCTACGQTYGGSQTLPIPCPEQLRSHPLLLKRSPVSDQQYRKLRDETLAILRAEGYELQDLRPGVDFQPLVARFPSHPTASFLWCSLGSVVVSATTKRLFEENEVTGVAFCPIEIQMVGKGDPAATAPRPSTGEPEDIIRDVELEPDPERFGPLYEMVVLSESARPPGAEVTSRCAACGREEYDRHSRQLVLTEAMIPDRDLFYLATTLWMVVNERVAEIIRQNGLTNVALEKLDISP